MSVLPSGILADLRSSVAASLNAQTIAYKVVTNGTAGAAVNLSALVTAKTRTFLPDANGNRVEIADVIIVRPMADETLVIGDIVVYAGHDYTVEETAGTDVRRITAAYRPNIGMQRTDRFRAEGG
jgi:voltage-gated potassium channel Kch